MQGEQLVDLDELVLRCRNRQAKELISEAVACYKAGAYRSCIVATWIAVVFDILHKLEELDLTGDKQARAKLDEFEALRKSADVEGSLKFEKSILDVAKDQFELISPLEHVDLVRLRDDRNRCAHPSMTALDEMYQPSAELARYHLKSAVLALLQHPPVQGKAAMDRLVREVSSEYFPTNVADAMSNFRMGPLARPRDALVRNFVIVLAKALLLDCFQSSSWSRYVTALIATRRMHRQIAEDTLAVKLSDVVSRIDDANLWRVVSFLRDVPDTFQYLQPALQEKLVRYAESMPGDDLVRNFGFLVTLEPFRPALESRLSVADEREMASLVAAHPCVELVSPALSLYSKSGTFGQAASRRNQLVIPLVKYFEPSHVDHTIQIIAAQKNIRGDYQVERLVHAMAEAGVVTREKLADAIKANGLENEFSLYVSAGYRADDGDYRQ